MEFIGPLQKSRLDQINDVAVNACERVDAAVAYIHDDSTLIRKCFELDKPLHLRGRYDSSKPVGIAILEKFLRSTSQNYRLTLVPDIFHPKVVWWRGYGLYIGSANLTNAAWFGNIEAGLFLDEQEIDEQDLRDELDRFFDFVDERAQSLTLDIVEQLKSLKRSESWREQDAAYEREFSQKRLVPRLESLDSVQHAKGSTRRENEFLNEWNSTLKVLGDIGQLLKNYRPAWVPADTPAGVHADQFLHAYYYNLVVDDVPNSHPFEIFHERNRTRPDDALVEAMKWWAGQQSAPSEEERMIKEWAVELRNFLHRDRIASMGKTDFIEVCKKVHAYRNHAQRVRYSAMGLPGKLPPMKDDERVELVASWMFELRSGEKLGPVGLIDWVIYGGDSGQTPRRIFLADNDPRKKIPHLGISILGEIVGWAVPDKFPPRNGRTSKALRALGYSPRVY